MVVKVIVRGGRGEEMTIDLCDTEEQFKSITVGQLKEKIMEKDCFYGRPVEVRLVFKDKSLEGDTTLLSEYGIQHMSVIDISAYRYIRVRAARAADPEVTVEIIRIEAKDVAVTMNSSAVIPHAQAAGIFGGGMRGKSQSKEELCDF